MLRLDVAVGMQAATELGVSAEVALELLLMMAAGVRDAQKEKFDGAG